MEKCRKSTVNSKKIIGLSGLYCAGKNQVALYLEKRGFPVLDVDKLGHEVIKEEKERLLTRFGSDILGPDGQIDRKRLGNRVFGRPEELKALEEIIHPGANQKTLDWIKNQQEKLCFVNAALLHRSSAFELLDALVFVEAPLPVRLLRAKKRDQLPWMDLFKRFWSQKKITSQFFKGKTDIYRVRNPYGYTNSGRFGFRRLSVLGLLSSRKKLEKDIDKILSLLE